MNSSDGKNSYTGKVVRINGRVDQTTQTVTVFVEVAAPDLKEGMYMEAALEARDIENAIKISRKLLVDQSEIFIVRDSILDLIEVNPVHFSDKDVVLQGVPDNMVILSKSVPGAYAGMLVKVNSEIADTSNKDN